MSGELRELVLRIRRFGSVDDAYEAAETFVAKIVDKAHEEGRAEVRERVERSYDHAYDIGDDAYEEGYRHRDRQVRRVLGVPE